MAKYRKKPVVIEAVRWNGKYSGGTEFPDWFRDAVGCGQIMPFFGKDGRKLGIVTLEGVMTAEVEDMVIKGVKGEVYPCKPDIFEATYEAA